jgi:hypothetical protein
MVIQQSGFGSNGIAWLLVTNSTEQNRQWENRNSPTVQEVHHFLWKLQVRYTVQASLSWARSIQSTFLPVSLKI